MQRTLQRMRTPRSSQAPRFARHPALTLTVLTTCQLMVLLDTTVVLIALPKIEAGLRFTPTSLSWVLNAYTLVFGGLLLLGGRLGDIYGRRRVFIFGILLFSAASLVGGFAQSAAWLIVARTVQGAGGAIASPTALALIATNFDAGPARNRALGVFAGATGAGTALGLLLGGVVTEWLSWRWALFINVPIGIALVLLSPLFLAESEPRPGRFDLAGALTSTAGMAAVVYGFIRTASNGWSDGLAIGSLVAGLVLLGVFVRIETGSTQPITPLGMFTNRIRAGSYLMMLLMTGALFGMFYFLVQFIENVLDYGPVKTGFAFLPVPVLVAAAAGIGTQVLPRIGPRPVLVTGAAVGTGGMVWLTQLSATDGYAQQVLGPMLMIGFGVGLLFVPLTVLAVSKVAPDEAGAASSLLNVMQQIGSALGLSILVTIFGAVSRDTARHPLAGASPAAEAHYILTHSMAVSFIVAAVFFGCMILLAIFVVNAKVADVSQVSAEAPVDASDNP